MRLLLVDTLNVFMHKLPCLWSRSFDHIKNEINLFDSACRRDNIMPVFVLDLYKLSQVGHQKWKRRQRKLYIRTRVVPCSATCLIGTVLAETDVAWTYATHCEADDLIIDLATKAENCTVLSGDKGFLRVYHRSFCVAQSYMIHSGQIYFDNVNHCTGCQCSSPSVIPTFKLEQNAAKYAFYLNELQTKCTMSKGVFYSAFHILPCMWCHLQRLRQHVYHVAGVQVVRESHVCATLSQKNGHLTWDNNAVHASYLPGFEKACVVHARAYVGLCRRHLEVSSIDFHNTSFAVAVTCAQFMMEAWYIRVHTKPTLEICDAVAMSRQFHKYLKMASNK